MVCRADPLRMTQKGNSMNIPHHLLLLLLIICFPCAAAAVGHPSQPREYVPGELLVKYREAADERVERRVRAKNMIPLMRFRALHMERLRLPASMSVQEGMALLREDPEVEYVEPNYIRRAHAVPNDPLFGLQWALQNTGQTVNGVSGSAGADIDGPLAWDIETGGEVIIAVLDTGVAYNHPDLAANMWTNMEEVLDGTDTDGNGFVDDIRGWDFVGDEEDEDNDPMDPDGHGTFVAGIIAAQGNNGLGMTGVCWSARIMPLRFLNAFGEGSVADEIEAINYAVAMGAKVINASYGSTRFSNAEREAIAAAGEAGVLFVAAAGNRAADSDQSPEYPASYDLDNIISVAATTQDDSLAWFSNFGMDTVHVGAPGVHIVAPIPRRIAAARFTFEEGDAPEWELDSPWEVTDERAYEGLFSLGAVVEAGEALLDTSAVTPLLDLSERSGTMLSFFLRHTLTLGTILRVEAARSPDSPWEQVPVRLGETFFGGGISGSSPEWQEGEVDLGMFDGEAEAAVRFRLISVASATDQEVFIDDVSFFVTGDDESYSGDVEDFVFVTGSSFSAAVVTGLAGLLISSEPTLAVGEVRERILGGVDRLQPLDSRLITGGRINARRTLADDPQNLGNDGNAGSSGGGGCVMGEVAALPQVEWMLLVAVLLLCRTGRRGRPDQNGRWKKRRL
jgi:subtilisin family serine protease